MNLRKKKKERKEKYIDEQFNRRLLDTTRYAVLKMKSFQKGEKRRGKKYL